MHSFSDSAPPSAAAPADELDPATAIAIWNAVIASEGEAFLKGYPRRGRVGPFGDDEKVKFIREAFKTDFRDDARDRIDSSRAQVVRETARRLGLAPPSLNAVTRQPLGDPALGSMATIMLLGMQLASMLASGETTTESLERQPALWFHGVRSPLSGEPALDRVLIGSALAWARNGFPRVVLASHRLAAGMMWIDATRGMDDVRPPWDAFWITLPNNLVRYGGRRGTVDATECFVHVRPSGLVVAHFGDTALLGLKIVRPNLGALGQASRIDPDWTKHHVDGHVLGGLVDRAEPASDSVGAATEMLASLVLSVCVDMTAHRPAPRTPRRSGPKGPPTSGLPASTDYVIERRAVHVHDPNAEDVNCINAVRDYVRDPNRTGTATTQRIHRAHYQMQTHGPRSSLRRLQLHRAYRQGPQDAPVAVRPHVRR